MYERADEEERADLLPPQARQGEGGGRHQETHKADARPPQKVPAPAGKESAHATADKEGCHEDGVDAVAGLGHLGNAGALVAHLHELQGDVEHNDGDGQSYVAIAPQPTATPGEHLQHSADETETAQAQARQEIAHTTGHQRSGSAAETH